MTSADIKNRISEMASHFTFVYNKKNCGIDPYSSTNFDIWCGDSLYTATSIDEVMRRPFFDGKSLNEISNNIEIIDF